MLRPLRAVVFPNLRHHLPGRRPAPKRDELVSRRVEHEAALRDRDRRMHTDETPAVVLQDAEIADWSVIPISAERVDALLRIHVDSRAGHSVARRWEPRPRASIEAPEIVEQ